MADVTYIILAGGAGTRLWPLSTEDRPKQFLALGAGERTLLQQAYDRVAEHADAADIFVITAARFVDLCRTQLPELGPDQVRGEPMRRDTAAAVLWGTLLAEQRHPGGAVVVLTADHVIEPAAALHNDIADALTTARRDHVVVTFGIVPTVASTAFGYLEMEGEGRIARVTRFVEKPDAPTAADYLQSGHHLWNSGMFVFRSVDMRAAFSLHLPEHHTQLAAAVADGSERAMREAFAALPKVSIDYGIMEKLEEVSAVRASFSWRDLGTFVALEPLYSADEHHNRARGKLVAQGASHNLVVCEEPDETVVLLGVDDLVVVRAGHRTLVMDKSRAGQLKTLVASLPEDLLVRDPEEQP